MQFYLKLHRLIFFHCMWVLTNPLVGYIFFLYSLYLQNFKMIWDQYLFHIYKKLFYFILFMNERTLGINNYHLKQATNGFHQLTWIKYWKGILHKLQRDLVLTFLHQVIETELWEREREPCLWRLIISVVHDSR